MNELKPCPFCGGKAKIVQITNGFVVRCNQYPCLAEASSRLNKEKAIEAWNTRAGVTVEGFHALIGWEE